MKCYTVKGSVASGAAKTHTNLFNPAATPTVRPAIFSLDIGCPDAPADVAYSYRLSRSTAVGTEGAGFVPTPLDPADPAAGADAGTGHTVEPTYTGVGSDLLVFAFNQRGTFSWVAAFDDARLVIPATQNHGIGLQCVGVTSGTAAMLATIMFAE